MSTKPTQSLKSVSGIRWEVALSASALIVAGGAFWLSLAPESKLEKRLDALELVDSSADTSQFQGAPQELKAPQLPTSAHPRFRDQKVQPVSTRIPLPKRRISREQIERIATKEAHFENQRSELLVATEAENFTKDERQEALRLWAAETYSERRELKQQQNEIFLQKNFPHRYEAPESIDDPTAHNESIAPHSSQEE